MRKVIFLDIDGTLLKHRNEGLSAVLTEKVEILPGVIEKLNEWEAKGYRIILVTGRSESMRSATERQLESLGIFYSVLIMEVTGDRILINDKKPNGRIAASVINLDRNAGIGDIEL
jgi:hydroxymethylpyrimidine pyrophosphatase-like HAD family hydrolase